MAGRRRVYTGSSSPRYRLKMFDYLSKGGRIPAFLVQPAVEAMDNERSTRFGAYKGFKDRFLEPAMSAVGLPSALRGLCIAFAYKILKEIGGLETSDIETRSRAIERVKAEHPINDNRLWEALESAFGIKKAMKQEAETEEQKTQPARPS